MGSGDAWAGLRAGPHPTVSAATVLDFTASDGLRSSFTVCEPPPGRAAGGGRAVVLLHGWSGSRRYFDHLLEPLAALGLPTYAPDLRGHGDSAEGCGLHGLRIACLAADLRDFLSLLQSHGRLGPDGRVTLVGTSMGVAVIWSYIEQFGEDLVRSLVLVDQAPLQNRVEGWALGSTGCYDAETLRALQDALARDMGAFAEGNAEACFSQTTAWMQTHPDTLALLGAETRRCRPAVLAALMADHTQLDWRPLLPRVRAETWNCVGLQSKIFPWQGVAWVGDAMPNARNVPFEKGGHWLYVEEPQRFAEVVAEAAATCVQ